MKQHKVLLVADAPGWALEKNARDIVKYNDTDILFDVGYSEDLFSDYMRFYREYDIIHCMYKGSFFRLVKDRVPLDSVTTGIRSYHRWDKKKLAVPPGYNVKPPWTVIRKLRKALLVNCNCKKLWYLFSPHVRVVHTRYTCDTNTFFPENVRSDGHGDKLIVGWAGSLDNHGNKRGFREFIEPICNELPEVALSVQAKEKNYTADDAEMRRFYNSCDLYICASRSEGGPRPVLEASACGVPVLSTDVGLVPELIRDGVNGFIVERNYQAIRNGLLRAVAMRDELPEMGRRARALMEGSFSWEKVIGQWTDFFQYALELKRLKAAGVVR